MQRKRVIGIGIEGPPPKGDLGPGISWQPISKNRGVALLGVEKRSEDDVDRALEFALLQLHPKKKLCVKEITIEISKRGPQVDWDGDFAGEFGAVEEGEAMVSPELARIYDRLFLFERVEGDRQVTHYLRGRRKHPGRLRGIRPTHVPLVGREAEIVRLKELVEQVGVDQGQIVGIVGDAGIGKTRLLEAFKEYLRASKIPFAEGAYRIREEHQTFSGIRQAIQTLVGTEIETLSRWEIDDIESDFIRLLLQPASKIDRFAGLTDEQIRSGLFHAMRKLLHAIARTPLVVILEDLHWADPASLQLLEQLSQGLESTRLLLVLLHRPHLTVPWMKRLNYTELRLTPFREEETETFLRRTLDVDRIPVALLGAFTRLSSGNPFFIEETARRLTDDGKFTIETTDDGRRILRSGSEAIEEIPATIHSLVGSRFDQLPPEEQEALGWASLLGASFEATEWSEVSDASIASNLIQKGFILEESSYPRQRYRFQHDLIFEIVRETVADRDRQVRHAQIATMLAKRLEGEFDGLTDRIANHFLESDDPSSAWTWAIRAGTRNLQLFSYPTAKRFFASAYNLQKPTPIASTPDQLFEPWIRTLIATGDLPEAGTRLAEWRKCLSKNVPRRVYESVAAEFYWATSEHEKCLRATEIALRELSPSDQGGETHLRLVDYRLTALTYLGRGHDVIHEGLAGLRAAGEQQARWRCRLWSRMAYMAMQSGEISQAADYLRRAERLFDAESGLFDQMELLFRRTSIDEESMQFEASITRSTEAIRIAESAGLRVRAAYGRRYRAYALEESGRFCETMNDIDSVQKEARIFKVPSLEQMCEIVRTDVYLDLGADDLAACELELLSQRKQLSEIWGSMTAEYLRSTLDFRQGRFKEAVQRLRATAKRYQEGGHRVMMTRRLARALVIEALAELRPPASIADEYRLFRPTLASADTALSRVHLAVTDTLLAAEGIRELPTEQPPLDPASINSCWLRQRATLTMIRYLAKTGRRKESDQLREEYWAYRKSLLPNIPEEFHESFLNHSEFGPNALELRDL